jgi:hypothetical protein
MLSTSYRGTSSHQLPLQDGASGSSFVVESVLKRLQEAVSGAITHTDGLIRGASRDLALENYFAVGSVGEVALPIFPFFPTSCQHDSAIRLDRQIKPHCARREPPLLPCPNCSVDSPVVRKQQFLPSHAKYYRVRTSHIFHHGVDQLKGVSELTLCSRVLLIRKA